MGRYIIVKLNKMLDLKQIFNLKPKPKPEPVVEQPKVLPKPNGFLSLSGKLFVAFVILHVVFLAYFIWFMVTASITETEDEVQSIMKGEEGNRLPSLRETVPKQRSQRKKKKTSRKLQKR